MATTTSASYDASSIKHLSGVQAVRAKPAMYIGPTDGGGIFTILRELLDNARDENLAGHCTLCEVFVDEDGSYWVTDNGRGMPTGNMQVTDSVSGKKYTMPALQAITSLLHAGGKLEAGGKAYATSVGSHGVGQKATNFLSDEFDVWTFSGDRSEVKRWHHIGYQQGKLTEPMAVCKAPDHPFKNAKMQTGTMVRMKPDLTIFSEDKFPLRLIAEWSQIAAYFSEKLKVVFAHHSGKERTFFSPEGPVQYVTDQVSKLKVTAISLKVFTYRDALVDCVWQMTTAEGCEVAAFTNGLANPDKGVHFNSLFISLMGALTPYIKRGQEFGQQELRDGLVGLVNVKLSSPKFSSQTKEKLVDDRAGKPLQELLTTALKEFFLKNKSLAIMLCERASELRKLKSKFTASKQVLNKLKQVQRIGLPAKASVSANCKPEHRELFLLEGESAAGLCAAAGTLVLMADGSQVPIEMLTEDSVTLAFNGKDIVPSRISSAFKPSREPVYEMVEVCIEGEPVLFTLDHPFLTTEGWVKAQDLTTEHVLISGV